MAGMKLGSKSDAFKRQGKTWICTTGLPSDVVVEVEEISFHLHKFPLLSRSGVIEKLIAEASAEEQGCVIKLPNIPGSAKTFELVAKFCYNVKLELTASNAVYLRCAAEHLEMSEEYGEGNLTSLTETFINQVILPNWKDSLKALQTCDDILPHAEQLQIPQRCIESLSTKFCTDPELFGWPVMDNSAPMKSPGGSLLWNGISTGSRPKRLSSNWWYEDASILSLPLYKRLISNMESQGVNQEIISGSLNSYAKKHLPGLNRREHSSTCLVPAASTVALSEEDQKLLVEEIDKMLPMHKGLVPVKFLFGLLRTAKILKADSACVMSLEKRIGMQLEEATLEDLLMPNFTCSTETLYDVDCIKRVFEHFLTLYDGSVDDEQLMGLTSLTPITMVGKLIDGYLAEVASDVNLKLPKFQSLAAAVPEYARPLDDGLYCAVDIFLKSRPWLVESDREQLCLLLDCQKLSLEACTHAAQNERLPLRTIVQVLFFEQLQLRTSIAGCLLVSDNDGSRQLRSGPNDGGWAVTVRENEVLKVGMNNMRTRVSELEKECSNMRQEIQKMEKVKGTSTWGYFSKKFGVRLKFQMCRAEEEPASKQTIRSVLRGDSET